MTTPEIHKSLTRIFLSDNPEVDVTPEPLTEETWKEFSAIAIRNGIGPLIGRNPSLLNAYGAPENVCKEFTASYYKSATRNILLYEQFKKIGLILHHNGIPFIALKGIYLAEKIYGDVGIRQMSDIDLLIRPDDGNKCRSLLEAEGYKSQDICKDKNLRELRDPNHLPSLVKDGIIFEFHLKIFPENTTVQVNTDDLWEQAIETKISDVGVLALSPEHLLLHLCLHLHQHFYEGKISILGYHDAERVMRHFGLAFNWNLFQQYCLKYHCLKEVYAQLGLMLSIQPSVIDISYKNGIMEFVTPFHTDVFDRYLTGRAASAASLLPDPGLRRIEQVKGFRNRMRYIASDVFPSRQYMIRRYRPAISLFVFWYYIPRFFRGLSRLLKHWARPSSGKNKNQGLPKA